MNGMHTTPASTVDAFTRHTASQVIYQIFPERFAIGGGLSSAQKLASPGRGSSSVATSTALWTSSPTSPSWALPGCT